MRYQFYREHKYVSAALNDLERLIARTDFCDSESVRSIEEDFGTLKKMLEGHAEYENERLHILLKQKHVPAPIYMHIEEHAAQDEQLRKIEEILHEISTEFDKEKRVEKGYHLYLIYRKFVADSLAHLYEEETKILPELQRQYSDAELRQIEAPTYSEMTPEEMVQMIQILFPHMNTYDKRAFLLDIQLFEPKKFEIVLKAIRPIITEDECIAVQQLIT